MCVCVVCVFVCLHVRLVVLRFGYGVVWLFMRLVGRLFVCVCRCVVVWVWGLVGLIVLCAFVRALVVCVCVRVLVY